MLGIYIQRSITSLVFRNCQKECDVFIESNRKVIILFTSEHSQQAVIKII